MICERVAEELKERFREARAVVVLTGAGISAESGVPTFRGGGGATVWRGMPVEKIATPEMWRADPVTFWQWYAYRREVIERAEPNAAHRAIAAWERQFERLTVITQNVDGLHQRAGSRKILELHGSLWRVRCLQCGLNMEDRRVPLPEIPPRCPSCGGILRPDVVLFGEVVPETVFSRAVAATAECELFLVVGTSAVVYPAAVLPVLAKQHRAFVIEVNPETTPVTGIADVTILGRAGEILPHFSPEGHGGG
ncbi:NAD-dependent protein deacylase [bacterium HR08]|nr:NAD-dependent protein deacylase [bacterium HR08]